MKATSITTTYLARAAITLLLLITMTQGAWGTDFITDVMLIGGTKTEVNTLKNTYQDKDWTVITETDYCTTGITAITFNSDKTDAVCEDSTTTACDLNKGAGGDHIYMHTTTDMTIGSFRANLLINNIRGDVNGDGATNVTDVTMTVDHILGITSNNFIFDNADVNRDGSINVTDVTTLVDIILGNYNNTFDVVTNLDDTPITYGGGGSGPARAKGK